MCPRPAGSGVHEGVSPSPVTPTVASSYNFKRHASLSASVHGEYGGVVKQQLDVKSPACSQDAAHDAMVSLSTAVEVSLNDRADEDPDAVAKTSRNARPDAQPNDISFATASRRATHPHVNTAPSSVAQGNTSPNRLLEVASLLTQAATLLSTVDDNPRDTHLSHACVCHESRASPEMLAQNRSAVPVTPNHPSSVSDIQDTSPNFAAGVYRAASNVNPFDDKETHQPDPLHHKNTQQPASAAQPVSVGQPTGWAAVEKALTDFDRQEIGAYKEDIDSLLTFVSTARISHSTFLAADRLSCVDVPFS